MTCYCGHEDDEHAPTATGVGECEVEGCGCGYFEADEEEALT